MPDFDVALCANDGGKERTWKMEFTDPMCQKWPQDYELPLGK